MIPQFRVVPNRRCLAGLALGGALALASVARGQIAFENAAPALGIDHVWGGVAIRGDFGGGCALEDYDRDGDADLFLGTRAGTPLAAYRNDGDRFTEVTGDLGLTESDAGKHALFADFDGDGWRDLVLTRWNGPEEEADRSRWKQIQIYRACGDGTFENRTAGAGLEREPTGTYPGKPHGCAVGDVDKDGDLDLYVSYWKEGAVGPEAANALFRNEGDFRFVDVAADLGVASPRKDYEAVLVDLSGDAWPDIVVASDKGGGMTYYESDGAGGFADRTQESGLDGFTDAGTFVDGMGLAVGDFDNDGHLDVYCTNIPDGNVLYRNLGDGRFRERAVASGVSSELWGWGAGFLDADNDGWLDLFVANSSVPDDNRLYHNQRNRTFRDVAPAAGVSGSGWAYSSATSDVDRDGHLDLVVTHGLDTPTVLYRNQGGPGRWLRLRLEGTTSNRDAIGARVVLEAEGAIQVRELRGGTSYLGQDSPTLHFGVGGLESVDRLEIHWPGGAGQPGETEVFTDVATGRELLAVEGRGELIDVDAEPAPPQRLSLLPPRPNPFNPGVTLELLVPASLAGREVTVHVHDSRGRRVASLYRGAAEAGSMLFTWEGRDDAGRPAASGSYRALLRAGDETMAVGITLVR